MAATQLYLTSDDLLELDFIVDPKNRPINSGTAVKAKPGTTINPAQAPHLT
jgi:hypothetical protein